MDVGAKGDESGFDLVLVWEVITEGCSWCYWMENSAEAVFAEEMVRAERSARKGADTGAAFQLTMGRESGRANPRCCDHVSLSGYRVVNDGSLSSLSIVMRDLFTQLVVYRGRDQTVQKLKTVFAQK